MNLLPIEILLDQSGKPTYLLNPTPLIFNVALTASTSTALTLSLSNGVESSYVAAVINYSDGSTVWVSTNGSAASAPSSSSFTATNSELKPAGYRLPKDAVLNFYTPDTGVTASVSVYACR